MKSFQFSLRSMLAAVAVVGIGAGLWVAEPSFLVGTVEALILAFAPASAIIFVINSTGRGKAWWIGVAAACVIAEFGFIRFMIPHWDYFTEPANLLYAISVKFFALVLAWAFAPVVGLLCVLTHWLFVRPSQGPKG